MLGVGVHVDGGIHVFGIVVVEAVLFLEDAELDKPGLLLIMLCNPLIAKRLLVWNHMEITWGILLIWH